MFAPHLWILFFVMSMTLVLARDCKTNCDEDFQPVCASSQSYGLMPFVNRCIMARENCIKGWEYKETSLKECRKQFEYRGTPFCLSEPDELCVYTKNSDSIEFEEHLNSCYLLGAYVQTKKNWAVANFGKCKQEPQRI
ncbi:hypothetical protein ACFFRR_007167 [Megaselia abdita]